MSLWALTRRDVSGCFSVVECWRDGIQCRSWCCPLDEALLLCCNGICAASGPRTRGLGSKRIELLQCYSFPCGNGNASDDVKVPVRTLVRGDEGYHVLGVGVVPLILCLGDVGSEQEHDGLVP